MNNISAGQWLGVALFVAIATLLGVHVLSGNTPAPPAPQVLQADPLPSPPVAQTVVVAPVLVVPAVVAPAPSVPVAYKAAYNAEAAAFAKARANGIRAQCLRDAADTKIYGDIKVGRITDKNIFAGCK
jgi:hypothetical protein